jgi:RNA polymerase primary sigma factor
MAVKDAPPLSRFLRMAVVAGVESAVQIHIDRGDDLNARDDKGQTPLMLSAARNKVAICKLLLFAGADAELLDPAGRSALSIAQAAGALEAASAIEVDRMQLPAERAGDDPVTPELAASDPQTLLFVAIATAEPTELTAPVAVPQPAAPEMAWMAGDDGDGFDLSGWESEVNQAPPEGDPTLSKAAFEIQSAITGHQPIDTSADWDDFEAFLPDRATPLPRADDAEARARLRLVLLRAIREGSVPSSALEDLTRGEDGEPDADAFALLGMVINDLGAETDNRFEYWTPFESFEVFVSSEEKPDEEDAIDDAVAFVNELAGSRRNEPLRIYQREIQSEALLTAEAEVALGQAMERGVVKALDALAAWPLGIGAVLDAAKKVTSGAKPLRWLSSGPPVEPHDAETISSAEPDGESEPSTDEDGDFQFNLDANGYIGKLEELGVNAELLSGLAIGGRQDAPGLKVCRGALASLGLTRGFLMELADSKLTGEPGPALAFGQAMKAYRRARDHMAVANLKLVYSIAKKYLFSGQPLDDLLQEGNIGLIKAVDRYDWRRGFKFSTYATWWIRQQVGRYVADKGKTIRLPAHIYEKTQRIAQAARAYELQHGQAPSVEEIAGLVGLPIKKVLAFSRSVLEPLPLHEVVELDDSIAADAKDQYTARDPMDIVEDMQLIGAIDRFLETIKPKEARVLRMRFGIGIQESMTLEEIGARFDVTRERIRQIEATALRKLKHPARLDRLLRELNGATQKRVDSDELTDDSDDDADGDASAVANDTSPQLKPAAQATPMHERSNDAPPTALEKLLSHARAIGITVDDYPDGPDRRIWVHLTETPDRRYRKIVRKLIKLGFTFCPGKGYWR